MGHSALKAATAQTGIKHNMRVAILVPTHHSRLATATAPNKPNGAAAKRNGPTCIQSDGIGRRCDNERRVHSRSPARRALLRTTQRPKTERAAPMVLCRRPRHWQCGPRAGHPLRHAARHGSASVKHCDVGSSCPPAWNAATLSKAMLGELTSIFGSWILEPGDFLKCLVWPLAWRLALGIQADASELYECSTRLGY